MPLRIDTETTPPVLFFEGIVAIEETDQLLETLKEHPACVMDLSGCDHLHTAVLQTLKTLKTALIALPQDPFWEFCLAPLSETIDPQKETEAP